MRHLLVACWGEIEQLEDAGAQHVRECEACRREAEVLRLTSRLLRETEAEPVPTGFTQRVMAQVRSTEPGRVSWYQRTLGWLSPPAPVFDRARATALGLVLVLLLGGGIALYQGPSGPVDPPRPPALVDVDYDTLLLQHETLALTQALSEDAGMYLVSYTH